mgnify:CR=1 FL=1|tara:strand:+ start:112 stop:363 length:252 start_codon:yes stop_codon:yes gene_type:complete
MEKIQLNKIKDYAHYYKKYHNISPSQLKKLRQELNMTQKEFARLMGYYKESANSYICQLENGYVRIPKHFALVCNLIRKEYLK